MTHFTFIGKDDDSATVVKTEFDTDHMYEVFDKVVEFMTYMTFNIGDNEELRLRDKRRNSNV